MTVALPCRREELPVTRCRLSGTPELCHGQHGLHLDQLCQDARNHLAFNMPSPQAGQLEVAVDVGGSRHSAEAEIQPLSEQHVQKVNLRPKASPARPLNAAGVLEGTSFLQGQLAPSGFTDQNGVSPDDPASD